MSGSTMSISYRWVIVAAGGLLGCVAIGAMFSLPVFLRPMAQDTGWSVTGISAAMTFGFLAMAAASMVWGSLSDRFGPRPVVLTGSLVLASSLALASRAGTLGEFQLLFGLLVGTATAAVFAPMMACVTGWFETQRGLAVSLVSAGMGMAPMTMAPLAAWLVTIHDWRTAMLIVAGIAASLMVPAALLVRRPPALDEGSREMVVDEPHADMGVRQAVRSPQFITLMLANFFLLRNSFRADLPYGELCCDLRHPHDRGRFDLQRRGIGRYVWSYRVRSCRRPLRRPACAGDRTSCTGIWRTRLCVRLDAWTLLRRRRSGRLHLCWHNAALRRDHTGEFSVEDDGHDHWWYGNGWQPRDVDRSAPGGLVYDRFGSYALMYVGSRGMGLAAVLILMTFRPFPVRQTRLASV